MWKKLIALVLALNLCACSTSQPASTTNQVAITASVNNQKLKMNSVPPGYLVECGDIPTIESAGIQDVKKAYLETQNELIGVCMRHKNLAAWILEIKGSGK